ncbi:MAG: hypothetical protein WCS87_05865 [Methylococcaceae bacterium]
MKSLKPQKREYRIITDYEKDDAKIKQLKDKEAHYIIGGNTDPKELTDQEVVTAYKEQNKAERGFRFLKVPLFFVSSLFVKTPKERA